MGVCLVKVLRPNNLVLDASNMISPIEMAYSVNGF